MAQEHKRLQTKHHEILRRAVIGQSNRDIARDLGLSEVAVGILLRSTVAKIEIARLKEQAAAKAIDTPARVRLGPELRELQDLSVQHQLEIMHGKVIVDEKIKARVADQHVRDGIYKTDDKKEEFSFRDVIRAVATLDEVMKGGQNPKMIDVTPQPPS